MERRRRKDRIDNLIKIQTEGEALYSITDQIKKIIPKNSNGILFLFIQHTSCALTISEDWDPTAKQDLEAFLKHLAPRDLPFIRHTLEGSDDSPSHMKSILLHQHLALPIQDGKLLLGRWQGIFLAEFRDAPHTRTLLCKFLPDP